MKKSLPKGSHLLAPMNSLCTYQILSHFQEENPTKLVVFNVDDITIYIAERNFLDNYKDKTFKPRLNRGITYIQCTLDGAPYVIVYDDNTKHLILGN